MIPHILVIDDQISLPRFIALELQAEGYQVSVDCDLAELSSLQKLNPDLIVLNWELRQSSGLDVCRQLVRVGNQIPLIVVMSQDEWSLRSALELGAKTCLTKPFSMNDLLRIIDHHLNGDSKKMKPIKLGPKHGTSC